MFGEKTEEWSKKLQKDIPVWQSSKYKEAKEKAIELINSKKYDLLEGDFWILMNETKTGKMQYSGLIISHNGCLKINDHLDSKVDSRCFELDKEGYNNSLTYTYCDDELFEVGEVSKENCKNDYPYAMALKRCFDRVVLKKCKLAYAGVYSDSEADEFINRNEEPTEDNQNNGKKEDTKKNARAENRMKLEDELIEETVIDKLEKSIKNSEMSDEVKQQILNKHGYKEITEIKRKDYKDILEDFIQEAEKIKNAKEN